MTLRETQSAFAEAAARLILFAVDNGYAVTLAEAYRSPEPAALYAREGRGIANSNHTRRLAIDLNLFKRGRLLTSTDAYKELGEWFEGQHELARWGGRFNDGGHFSFEHEGVK